MTTKYLVERALPNGARKSVDIPQTRREAVRSAAQSLKDNARVSTGEARKFADRLAQAPVGTWVDHEPTSHRYRIVEAP